METVALAISNDRRAAILDAACSAQAVESLKASHDAFFGVLNDPNLHPIERTLITARATVLLREALSGDILRQFIMPLMNSPDGFDTDRNPRKHKPWMNSAPPTPYPEETVLDCAVSAILHGLPLVGNMWNIIADGFYARKEGFEYLVATVCRYSVSVSVPAISSELYAEGGYLRVTVTVKYQPFAAPEEEPRIHAGVYSVRLNKKNKVGVESCEGKAKRKALRDLWHILSGQLLPEAEMPEEGPSIMQAGGMDVVDTAPAEPPEASSGDAVKAQLGAWRARLKKLQVKVADVCSWLQVEELPAGLWTEEDRAKFYRAAEDVAAAQEAS